MLSSVDRFFGLSANATNFSREVTAGLTTFLAMAYITVVNPLILSDAGMDFGAVFVATCCAAAFGSLSGAAGVSRARPGARAVRPAMRFTAETLGSSRRALRAASGGKTSAVEV